MAEFDNYSPWTDIQAEPESQNASSPFQHDFEAFSPFRNADEELSYEQEDILEYYPEDDMELMDDEAGNDNDFIQSEIYPGPSGVSPFALQAKKQWKRSKNELRPSGWQGKVYGLVVHTSGGSLPGKAIEKGIYPTIAAIDHYSQSSGCHYINGFKGIMEGDLVQVANENKEAWGVGMTDQRKSIENGRFEKDLPDAVVQLWKTRWPAYSNPMALLPKTNTANSCYIHVECLPVVYSAYNKTIIDPDNQPMRPGLRFTKAQHDSVAILAYDIAYRNGWPMNQQWWRTSRLLGHEDLTPLNRLDCSLSKENHCSKLPRETLNKKRCWDPGGLRENPYFDWDYVYRQIENIHKNGYQAILKPPVKITTELAGTYQSFSDLFAEGPAGTRSATSGTPKDWTKAIRLNRSYADSIGWNKYYDQINSLLLPFSGQQNVSLGEEDFARAVSVWQKQNGFSEKDSDGIIGKNTWGKMQSRLNFPVSPASAAGGTDQRTVSKVQEHSGLIESISSRYKLNPNIARGIIAAESGGNPRSGEGSSGYKGLMQAERTSDQLKPEVSLETGIKKFKDFRDKTLNPWLVKLGISVPAENDENYLKACLSCYNAGPVTALKAIQYAHKAGDWKQWLLPENYLRALVFSGGYARYSSCNKGKSATEIDKASAERIKYRFKTNGWRNEPDPAPWTSLLPVLDPVMRCWIETKYRNTPGYLDKFLRYYRYFESNRVARETEVPEDPEIQPENMNDDFQGSVPDDNGLDSEIAEVIELEAAKVQTAPKTCEGIYCWAKTVLNSQLGMNLQITNVADEATKKAIGAFQEKNNLTKTNRIDAATERALLECDALLKHEGTAGESAAANIINAARTKIEDWTKQAVADKPEITDSYRDPRKLWAFVLHQMAFKRKSRQTGNYSDPGSYLKTGAHFCIMFDGRIIQLHQFSRMIWHAQCISPRSVAVEFEGNFPDIKGRWWVDKSSKVQNKDVPTRSQYDSGRFLASYLKIVLGTTHILAHRQSAASRANDPGPDIWFNVGQWAMDNLKLTDGGAAFKCGSGNPVLPQWRTWGDKGSAEAGGESEQEETDEFDDYVFEDEELQSESDINEEEPESDREDEPDYDTEETIQEQDHQH